LPKSNEKQETFYGKSKHPHLQAQFLYAALHRLSAKLQQCYIFFVVYYLKLSWILSWQSVQTISDIY